MEQDNPPAPLPDALQPKLVDMNPPSATPLTLFSNEEPETRTNGSSVNGSSSNGTSSNGISSNGASSNGISLNGSDHAPRIEWVLAPEPDPVPTQKTQAPGASKSSPASAASGGYLARPSNIYAEEPWTDKQSNPEHATPAKEPILNTTAPDPSKEENSSPDMQLVFRETNPTADEPGAHQTHHTLSVPNSSVEEPAAQDDADDPKRRAAERINKLRNLSFNINAVDPNNEFETVPAYIRRNLELYNTISNVENFYSNYEVKTDENNNTEISTINTFLDGKRPD